MSVLSSFPDVRTRLLALVAFIIVPVALITIVLASAAHQSFSSDIDRQWRQMTGEYAQRTHVWLQGATRTMFASAGAASVANDPQTCNAALREAIAVNLGFDAIRVDFSDGRSCVGAVAAKDAKLAADVSRQLRAKPRNQLALGVSIAAEVIGDRDVLAIQADAPAAASGKWTATALFDPKLLENVFAHASDRGDIVALLEKGETVVAASGGDAATTSWLPATEPTVGPDYEVAAEPSRSGATFDYATQPVLGQDFYILSRFDGAPRRIAWLRTLVLVLTPLFMLGTVYVVYSRAIQSELLRWIDGIKEAMLARKTSGRAVLAPESDQMPSELRDLAASFNEMTHESEIREQSLRTLLAENEFLIRELHHRVKTSLQIIQSYLSLTRRLDGPSGHPGSVAAMEARVQVMSIAYRKAFSQGRMRDVRIRQFATEIADNLAQAFQRPGLTVDLNVDTTAALMIDRAIPFGLALVESVMAGLAAEGARLVSIRIRELEGLRVQASVATDGVLPPDRPNAKLMAGLALQIEASVEPPEPGTIIRWLFQAAPPPVIA